MYAYTKDLLFAAPAIEPVSVDEAARQCRITTHDEDTDLAGLITTARQHLETVCWSAFITQTWDYWWDAFDAKICIPRPPFQSVSTFQYTSATGVLTTVPAGTYEISAENGISYARLQYLATWPTPRGYRDDVTMRVKCGYGDSAADVPLPIRQAIKLLVAHMYYNRGDGPPEQLPPAIDLLIQNYRMKGL
jgi:uncharacterized phiE125 gp8 family phage protein